MNASANPFLYRFSGWTLLLVLMTAAVVYLTFNQAIASMVGQWGLEEFSHGYLIPVIALFLVWQRRAELQTMEFGGAWSGCAVVAAGVVLDVLGRLSNQYALQQLALLIVVTGLVLALVGWRGLRVLAAALGVLVFMIPLPPPVLAALSADLQMACARWGVALIRLGGLPVYLQGNIIDMGRYALQVADACSGLRYLLPLATVGYLMACFYQAPFWRRAVLVLSTVPLTVGMNSVRIAAIAFLVNRWGIGLAKGLAHQVEGWLVFIACIGVMWLEIRALHWLSGDVRALRDAFRLELPVGAPHQRPQRLRALPAPLAGAAATLLVGCAAVHYVFG